MPRSCSIHPCSRLLSTSMHCSLALSCSCSLAISSRRFVARCVSRPSCPPCSAASSCSSTLLLSQSNSVLSSSKVKMELPRLGSSPLAILCSICLTLSASAASCCRDLASSLLRSSSMASSARSLHATSCPHASWICCACVTCDCRMLATSSSRCRMTVSISSTSCSISSSSRSRSASTCIARSLMSSSTLLVTSRVVLDSSMVDLRLAPSDCRAVALLCHSSASCPLQDSSACSAPSCSCCSSTQRRASASCSPSRPISVAWLSSLAACASYCSV
mmetsp:Transcript_48197/g.120721  ORF Transcript_48197/g.120721 Transcript_48197/m.120721 type:complete len:276 (+) Transcript_48197:226-1053(+)